jgi:hypothetical protein
MANRDLKNILGGSAISLAGLLFFVEATSYDLGTLTHMGPGYFPAVIGILTLGAGLSIMLPAFACPGPGIEFSWRPFLFVGFSMAVFAYSLPRIGLIPAVFLLVAVATFGDATTKVIEGIVLAVLVCAGIWLIFKFGLGMPMPSFRRPF